MRRRNLVCAMLLSVIVGCGGAHANAPSNTDTFNYDAVVARLKEHGMTPVPAQAFGVAGKSAAGGQLSVQFGNASYSDASGTHWVLALGNNSEPSLRGSAPKGEGFTIPMIAARDSAGNLHAITLRAEALDVETASERGCPPGGGVPPQQWTYVVPLDAPASGGEPVEITLPRARARIVKYSGQGSNECAFP